MIFLLVWLCWNLGPWGRTPRHYVVDLNENRVFLMTVEKSGQITRLNYGHIHTTDQGVRFAPPLEADKDDVIEVVAEEVKK